MLGKRKRRIVTKGPKPRRRHLDDEGEPTTQEEIALDALLGLGPLPAK